MIADTMARREWIVEVANNYLAQALHGFSTDLRLLGRPVCIECGGMGPTLVRHAAPLCRWEQLCGPDADLRVAMEAVEQFLKMLHHDLNEIEERLRSQLTGWLRQKRLYLASMACPNGGYRLSDQAVREWRARFDDEANLGQMFLYADKAQPPPAVRPAAARVRRTWIGAISRFWRVCRVLLSRPSHFAAHQAWPCLACPHCVLDQWRRGRSRRAPASRADRG